MSDATGGSAGAVSAGDAGASVGEAQGGQAATPPTPRMLKLMLDNKEVELPESEVVGHFKRGKEASKMLSLAQQRKEEALREKAASEGLVARLKKGGAETRAALRDLGVDPAMVGQEEILEIIRQEKMSPAERREYELQQKLKGYEDEKTKAENEKKSAAHKEDVQRHMDELGGLFTEALTKTGLPKSAAPALFPRLAALYKQNEEAGLESNPEEMAHHAMEGVRELHQGIVSGLKGTELLDFLGPKVVAAVLTANLGRGNPSPVPGVRQPSPTPSKPKPLAEKLKGRNGDDYLRELLNE